MNETTFYRVCWTRAGLRPEIREFPEWEAALAFYEEVAEDRRTLQARMIEVSEKEVRCMEHENCNR